MRRRSPTPDASTDRASASWRRHIAVGLRRTLAVAVLLGTWEAATRTGVEDPFTASSLMAIGAVLGGLFADGTIYAHIEATFIAALLGLMLGIGVGVILGAIAGLFRPVAER